MIISSPSWPRLFMPSFSQLYFLLKYVFIQFKGMYSYVYWVHGCVPHMSRRPQRPVGVRTPGSGSSESPDLYAKKPTHVCFASAPCTLSYWIIPTRFCSPFIIIYIFSFNSVSMGVVLSTGIWDLPVVIPLKKSDCPLPVIFTSCQLG